MGLPQGQGGGSGTEPHKILQEVEGADPKPKEFPQLTLDFDLNGCVSLSLLSMALPHPALLCAEGSLAACTQLSFLVLALTFSCPCCDYRQLEKEEDLRHREMLWTIPREDGPELSALV